MEHEQSRLLAETILQLETYLQNAGREAQLLQTEMSRVRFVVQVLRDGTDTSFISQYMEKMKMTSQHTKEMTSLEMKVSSSSNGHHHLDISQNGIEASNQVRDRYLRSAKEWMAATVTSSRTPMTPGEVFRLALQAGIKMHKNYPYVALKQLANAGRLRVEGRAYSGVSLS